MSRSVLLQLARDSIEEVFQAQRSIQKEELLEQHPLLSEPMPLSVNIYIDEELKGSFATQDTKSSLLENIIIGAKKAAFEDSSRGILTTSEYLHAEIELILITQEGEMSQRDKAIIS